MDAQALVRWKEQIATYQQRVKESQSPQQTTLFDVAPVHCDPETIDPFGLEVRSLSFYRIPEPIPLMPKRDNLLLE